MLTLRPTPPDPVTAEKGRAELVSIWDGLDQEGRRVLLAQARAVAEVTGRGQSAGPDRSEPAEVEEAIKKAAVHPPPPPVRGPKRSGPKRSD